jgi:hypothetical protein
MELWAGANLVLSATTRGEGCTVVFIADDQASAHTVLENAGIKYTMRPVLTIWMENQPGTGAATFRKLADAAVKCRSRSASPMTCSLP